MKAPVLIVTATLTAAILLAGWLLIVTGTRSESMPAGKISQASPYPSSLRTQGTHTARSLFLSSEVDAFYRD